MKIKQLALATFSTLYMGSAAAAAVTLPTVENTIDLPDFQNSGLPANLKQQPAFEAFELNGTSESKSAQVNRVNGLPTTQGVNQKFNQIVKFTPEEGIEGIQEYFVVLHDSPVAQYTGGIPGLPATHLRTVANEQYGSSINVNEANEVNLKTLKASSDYQHRVEKYESYLTAKQQTFLQEANGFGFNIQANTHYGVAVNAFTTSITQDNAAELAKLATVKSIHRVTAHQIQTLVDAVNGVRGVHDIIGTQHYWDLGAKGEGIIVGVADTGINTDHPSFMDFGGGKFYTDDSGITWETADPYDHINPWGDGNYVGDCLKYGFEHMCNDKLIGVRSYERLTNQYKERALIDHVMDQHELEYSDLYMQDRTYYAVPPVGEDHAGHGSHTAGTAAGNAIKDVMHLNREINGPGLPASKGPIGDVSGIAPRANVIAYQVCISANSNSGYAGCLADVMVLALEDAIRDGVDVLNWSLGGNPYDSWDHPIGQAFLSARESGMHIAVAAGNSGYQGTVKHAAPWILTVGATQTNRREMPANAEEMSRDAAINASIDDVPFDISLTNRWYNISGEHENGKAVLAEFMGACVNDDCSEGLVCKQGYELLEDDLCYLECTNDEFRDPDTKQCDSFGDIDIGDQHDPANCLIGTEWVAQDEVSSGQDWGCLDINRDVPTNYTTRESICLTDDDAVFPSLTDEGSPYEQYSKQRFYCPEIDVDDAHPNYRGRLGGSKGIVCAYGVETYMETEFSNGLIWNNKQSIIYHDGDTCEDSDEENCVPEDRDGDGENSTIDQPTIGQCRVRAPADRDYENYERYENSTGPVSEVQGFGVVSSRPVETNYKVDEPLIASTQSEQSATVQANAVGRAPEMRVFEGDKYCENLSEWRNPAAPVAEAYDFDDAVVFCARGNGDNISLKAKSENVIAAAMETARIKNRAEDDYQASVVLYNDYLLYNSLYRFPSKIPFAHINTDTWINDFAPFFKGNPDAGSLTDLVRDRRITLHSEYYDIERIEEDDDRIDNVLANFTSKGPHYYFKDLMPVQVMAPGVHVYAAWSDNTLLDKGWNSADFGFSNGTSMAAPVVTGTMAVFKQLRPNWTEHERESALTMTASEVAYRTIYIDEDQYEEDNPDHSRSVSLQPELDDNGELIYDEDNNIVMKEVVMYLAKINVSSWHVGTGLIDLKAATNTGLVLDETLANMKAANPSAGGDARQLNMPYLFDGSCPETCTWLRTFTAKRAGSWKVEIDKLESAVQIEASIDSFDVEVGDKVTIMFTAKIDRSIAKDQYDSIINGVGYTGGEVRLVATDATIPQLRLPVGVSLDVDRLPALVRAEASADTGKFPIDLSMPAMATDSMITKIYHQDNVSYINQDSNGELATSSFGEIELQTSPGLGQTWIGRVELALDETKLNFDYKDAHNNKSAKLIWVDVPEGTKMLGIDTLRKVSSNTGTTQEIKRLSGTLMMVVGRDIVEPGIVNGTHEITCASFAQNLENFCYVVDPQPGKYWILMQNVNDLAPTESTWIKDTFDYAVSIVSEDMSTNMLLQAPTEVNPAQGVLQMDLTYSLPMKSDHASYAVAELYSNEHAIAADMGTVPIRLYRKEQPISLEFHRTQQLDTDDGHIYAGPGSYVKVNLNVAENLSGYNRGVDLKLDLPEGVSFVRNAISGDVRFLTGFNETEDAAGFELSLYQPNTHRLGKGYVMTTNINPDDPNNANHPYVIDGSHNYNPQCRTPGVGTYTDGTHSNGGYVDLVKLNPFYARLMKDEDTYVDLEQQFYFDSRGYDVSLYDGPRRHTEFKMSPKGYVSAGIGMDRDPMGFGPGLWPQNEIFMAPMWRKGVKYNQTVEKKDLIIGESTNSVEGMTMALFADGIEYKVLVEWDNAFTQNADVRYNDSMDFQAWFDLEHSYRPGTFEIMYAYDNLNMLPADDGFNRNDTVGLQGLESDVHFFGLIKAPRREFFASNNLEEVLFDDLVICYDYYGPDYSASDFTFWLRIDEQSAGQDLELTLEHTVDSVHKAETYTVSVPSQITIADFNNIVVQQGNEIQVPVFYADSNLTANSIIATSDKLNVSLDGNNSGALLTINAECSFTGDTTVTVKVADMHNENDIAQKDINVHVVATAGYEGKSCSTTNSDESTDTVEEESKSSDSSGGSFGFLMLLAIAAGFRFRKINA
ncbi:S8 family serine peptidase [Thalassotalea fonticola]|uniref:S8 family serine peptidase n=1 Tax=Thalassotalea fonticola TaxID=3065649 RepID=A0ABZ0GU29_9GAMM|nr:S8 family serine peptidase [Colwelliaceae bacterium S1-1]